MKHLNDHILKFMEKCAFPAEAVEECKRIETRLDNEEDFGKIMDAMCYCYMFPKADDMGFYLDKIENEVAPLYKENHYTLHLIFLMNCTEELLKRYKEKGISEEIYWDTVCDIRYKLIECMECEHCVGTFVAGWFEGFFEMNRFALGRFQFEYSRFDNEGGYTSSCGHHINNGDFAVGFHIPSSGVPLTEEVRLDSYKRAYEFFKDRFEGKNCVFVCGSWLLFPPHREFLPSHLNILKFMDDFEIIRSSEREGFGDDWRVFGHYTEYPLEQWPEDTSLRKAYKNWLLGGNKTGSGYGVIVFDGEKILK